MEPKLKRVKVMLFLGPMWRLDEPGFQHGVIPNFMGLEWLSH
jgi:hypothetical protein